MKKLLAYLLCLTILLMPTASLAQGAEKITFTFDVNLEQLNAYLSLLEENGEIQLNEDVRNILEPLTAVANCASLEIMLQEKGLRASLLLNGNEVLWANVITSEAGLHLTTSLLPDLVLQMPLGGEKGFLTLMNQIVSGDWEAFGNALMADASAWLATLHRKDETGHFVGDAYDDGTRAISFTFDDRDVAVLVTQIILRLADSEQGAALLQLLDVDANDLHRGNLPAAQQNRYDYLFRMVYNESGNPAGISLIVYENETQLATVSAGLHEGAGTVTTKVVAGFGMNDQVVYVEWVETESGQETTSDYAMYLAKPGMTLDAAKKVEGNPVTRESTMTKVKTAENDTVIVSSDSVAITKAGQLSTAVVVESAADGTKGAISCSVTLNDAEAAMYGVQLVYEPAEAASLAVPNGQIINVTDLSADDEAALQASYDQGVKMLAIYLLKYVPPEVLVQIIEQFLK